MAKSHKNKQASYSTYTSSGSLFWLKWLVLLSVFGGFGFLVWYASVHKEELQANNGTLTLIEPEKTSVKERAENPGGMEVPNRDKQVFDLLEDPDVKQAEEEKFKEICTAQGGDIVCNEAMPKVAEIKKQVSDGVESAEGEVDLARGEIGEMIEKLNDTATDQKEEISEDVQSAETKVEKTIEKAEAAVKAALPETIKPLAVVQPKVIAPVAVKEAEKETVSAVSNATIKKGAYGIQLASYRGLVEAQNGSKIFTSKFSELKSLDMDVQEADVKGKTYYRLRYFGFDDKAAAESMCAKLKAQGQGCFKVQY